MTPYFNQISNVILIGLVLSSCLNAKSRPDASAVLKKFPVQSESEAGDDKGRDEDGRGGQDKSDSGDAAQPPKRPSSQDADDNPTDSARKPSTPGQDEDSTRPNSGSKPRGETPGPGPAPATPTTNPNSGGIGDTDVCYKGDEWACAVEAVIVTEMNKLRPSPLKQDGEAAFVARDWSQKQAARGSIGHEGFNGDRLKVLRAEFPKSKIKFLAAENVGMSGGGNSDPATVGKAFVKMWNESPGHKTNMLGNHKAVGVGV